MKKKLVSLLMVATMAASMFAGCGSSEAAAPAETAPAATTDAPAADAPAADAAADQGSVLNIHCWNEEFKSRVTDHYPGYEEVDGTHGKIGDVEVVWDITPSDDNAYQNKLDEDLLAQADAAADSKIDIFLVEADYALKYVDTDYTMAVADLGITDADLANQYKYTQDIMTDSNGVLKGLSWQGCPGILFYNRDIAAEVLGSEEPADVQEAVKDWDTFMATAQTMADAGYLMTATVNDAYRVYSNNVSSKWVDGGKVSIDANIDKWVDDSMALVDMGATKVADLWSDDWSTGFSGGVFCYFGPAWLINFCMGKGDEGTVATAGRWGGTVGPQSFFWGGTWICAATGTDNTELVKDIMLKLTTDTDIMTEIVVADDDFVNNKAAMEAMAASDYASDVMGGQNPLQMYCDGCAKIDLSNLSAYDQGCNEDFQSAVADYFKGTCDKETAIANFKTRIVEKYPDVTAE